MANKEMKTIKFGQDSTDTYVITDGVARAGLSTKQDTLVSGNNIKTINNQSLLGSGNIDISGGGSYTLPIASSTTLGGIKVGTNLSITEDGTLNAEAGGASVPVFRTTKEILSKSWNTVLSEGAANTQTFGFYFGRAPAELLIDSSKGWSATAGDITINMTADTVYVTVGSTTENIYENGEFLAKEISDETATLKADCSTSQCLVFRNKDTNEAISFPLSIVSVDNLRNMTDEFSYVGGFSQNISEYHPYSEVSTDVYGIQAVVTSPDGLLSDASQTYTIQGEYFSLSVSSSEIKLTVAGKEFYLYTADNWSDQTYIDLADVKNDFRATVDIWGGGASTTGFAVFFRHLDWKSLAPQNISSSTGTKYISSIVSFGTATEAFPSFYNLENIVGYSNTILYKVQFDADYANNVNKQITINSTHTGLQLAPTYATAYFEGNGANIYENGAYVASTTFSNGCIWDLDTHILTFPNKDNNIFLIGGNETYLNDVGTGISFISEVVVPPSLPEASAYRDKMAVINDEENGIILTTISDGNKWSFIEDAVKLSEGLKDKIRQNSGQLYGVSFVGKYAISDSDPTTLNKLTYEPWGYNWNDMGLQRRFLQQELSDTVTQVGLSSFSSSYLPISANNTQVTVQMDYIYSGVLVVDVSEEIPAITFNSGLNMLFKQNGTRVANLDFSTTNTLYKITFNNYANYLLAECETISKSI